MNEKLLSSELDHLRTNMDQIEKVKLDEKDKEINRLKSLIESVRITF